MLWVSCLVRVMHRLTSAPQWHLWTYTWNIFFRCPRARSWMYIHGAHRLTRANSKAVHSSSLTQLLHIFRHLHRPVVLLWLPWRRSITSPPIVFVNPRRLISHATGTEVTSEERGQTLRRRLQQRHCVRLLGFCRWPLLIKHGRAQSVCEQFGRFRAGSVNHSHYQTIWDKTSRQRPLRGTLINWWGQSGLNRLETPVAWAQTKTPVAINL